MHPIHADIQQQLVDAKPYDAEQDKQQKIARFAVLLFDIKYPYDAGDIVKNNRNRERDHRRDQIIQTKPLGQSIQEPVINQKRNAADQTKLNQLINQMFHACPFSPELKSAQTADGAVVVVYIMAASGSAARKFRTTLPMVFPSL